MASHDAIPVHPSARQSSARSALAMVDSISAVAAYENSKHRWTWGLVGGQVPYLSGGYGQFITNLEGQDEGTDQPAEDLAEAPAQPGAFLRPR